MAKNLFLTVVLLFASFHFIQAQSASDSQNNEGFSPNLGVSINYSPTSFRFWGKMENTQQFYLSATLNHSEFELGFANFRLGSQLIVASQIEFPIDGLDGPREKRTGYGLVPLIVNLPFSSSGNTPFLTTSAGFIITDVSFPNALGTRFNYIIDIGLGYQFFRSGSLSYQFGYKLHHLSNGNSSIENPGIDSHMLFLKVLYDL